QSAGRLFTRGPLLTGDNEDHLTCLNSLSGMRELLKYRIRRFSAYTVRTTLYLQAKVCKFLLAIGVALSCNIGNLYHPPLQGHINNRDKSKQEGRSKSRNNKQPAQCIQSRFEDTHSDAPKQSDSLTRFTQPINSKNPEIISVSAFQATPEKIRP